jgi:transcriptional regulator with XRE-family HTH domain
MIGNYIKQLRQERGITQKEIATHIGVSVQAVSKWECGGTPDIELIPMIADFFNVKIDELFGRKKAACSSVNDILYQVLQNTPEAQRFEKAAELCWYIIKAISGVPDVQDVGYTHDSKNGYICSRCRIAANEGIAYAYASKDIHNMLIFPEPKNGFSAMLYDTDDYVNLYSTLSDPDMLRIVMFLYQRKAVPFSEEYACRQLNMCRNKMMRCIAKCVEFEWIEEEAVELAGGIQTLYRPILTEAFLAFLFYSGEVAHRFRLWYISNNQRTKPLL